MINIPILYEDDDIVALDKPAGIVVHPDGKHQYDSVTDFLLHKYKDIKDIGEKMILADGTEVERPGIVHRIDRDTSGVLLVAKTDAGFNCLKEQFKNREIKKTYHTFVYGTLNNERGVINKPIGRSSGGVARWAVTGLRGELREAVTKYKVIKSTKDASYLEVWPQTGRTHQIRVHLKSIHHPIVCDSLYATQGKPLLCFKRLALHASKIVFRDVDGVDRTVIAEFPEDFKKAVKVI